MRLPPLATLLFNRLKAKLPTTPTARHAKLAWKHRDIPISFSKTMLFLTLVFLFLPLFVVVFYSFNATKEVRWAGVSLKWYKELVFSSPQLWHSLWNSVIIAVTSSFVSTILGTLAAIGVSWYKFWGKNFIRTVSFLPMVLPEITLGVSTVVFFTGLHIPLGMFTIFAAHTTFCLPFVFMMVGARVDEFDYSIIEAARDLGATEAQTMTKVVVPAIMPGILSSFMISVTMSLEDFVITFFVAGPGSSTLPLLINSMIRVGVSPVINALSFVMILFTCSIAFCLRGTLKTIAAAK